MGNTELLYDQIERFLEDQLTEEERHNFLRKASNNPQIALEIQLHKDLRDTLCEYDVLNLKEAIQETIQRKRCHTTFSIHHFMTIAASLLIMVASFTFYTLHFSTVPRPEEIVEVHFVPYENILSVRSLEAKQDPFEAAMSAYQGNEYIKAIELLEQIPPHRSTYQMSRFYLGISHLAMKDGSKAMKYLSNAFDKEHPFHEISTWYLALALLQKGDIRGGKVLLKRLSKNKNAYRHDQAKEIVTQLAFEN